MSAFNTNPRPYTLIIADSASGFYESGFYEAFITEKQFNELKKHIIIIGEEENE